MADTDDDLDFEIVTNASQMAPPLPLRRERVILRNVHTTAKKLAAIWQYELNALDHNLFQETGRVYVNGDLQGVTMKNNILRFLAFTSRDPNGNRLWQTVEEAIAQLGKYGKTDIDLLLDAANRVNSPNPASAEKNSESDPTDS
jgi:hypothetical protein